MDIARFKIFIEALKQRHLNYCGNHIHTKSADDLITQYVTISIDLRNVLQ